MSKLLYGRIETTFTLLSPLSHIGDSIGPDSYLSTQDIITANGEPAEVFVYNGNAIRGVWRDCGAKYMLDKLGGEDVIQVPLEIFYLLYSGGAIGGKQSIDIDQGRRIRQMLPHLSIFGGGVGNMLLPGKLNVGEALPVCRELSHVIPEHCPGNRELSWRQATTEISYTRKDDAKDELLRPYLQPDPDTLQIEGGQQFSLAGPAAKNSPKKEDKNPQQMRYTLEVLCRGTVLWQETIFFDMTEVELGALVASIFEWSKRPILGGQSRVGMGKVDVDMDIQLFGGEKEPFLSIYKGSLSLYPPAGGAKRKYDEFLDQYVGYLDDRRDQIVYAIEGKEKK